MNDRTDLSLASSSEMTESEAFPELISAAHRMLEGGDALEAYRAFDEGALAEVPHALEAYLSQQRLCLN